MCSKRTFLVSLLAVLFIENVHSEEANASDSTTLSPAPPPVSETKPKEKGTLDDLFGDKHGERVHQIHKSDDIPEMGHLMSSLVSLLPDDMESNLRKEGFTVFLDKNSNVQGSGWGKPVKTPLPSFAVHGGYDPKAPEETGHFLKHLPLKSTKFPMKTTYYNKKPHSQDKRREDQPLIITMTRVEKPTVHFSSVPIQSSKFGGSTRGDSNSNAAAPPPDEISMLEIQSKAKFATMKIHPPPKPTPKPRKKKVTRPIVILLEDTITEESNENKDNDKHRAKNKQPGLSSLYHILSMLEQNEGAPVSVLPPSKTKDLEDSIDCIKCINDILSSQSMFDFDSLPQIRLSDSGVNAMGTPFDIIGGRLVKRETTKQNE